MTGIDRSRQAATNAVKQSARESKGLVLSDRFAGTLIDIAYKNQFLQDDRVEAKRALREAVAEEAQRHRAEDS